MPILTIPNNATTKLNLPPGTRFAVFRNLTAATIRWRLGDVVVSDAGATAGLTLKPDEERALCASHGYALPGALSFQQSSGGALELQYDIFPPAP